MPLAYSVCDGVLLPRLGKNGKELEICPECKCKHEARNTTLIKVSDWRSWRILIWSLSPFSSIIIGVEFTLKKALVYPIICLIISYFTGGCDYRHLDHFDPGHLYAVPDVPGSSTQQTCQGQLSGAHQWRCIESLHAH